MADDLLTPEQFAQKVKAKYPDYAKVPDMELYQKVLAKHPEYQSRIQHGASGSWDTDPFAKGGIITPNPGESFADTMKRAAKAGKNVTQAQIDENVRKAKREAPMVFGAAGGALADVPGALLGGAIGGYIASDKKTPAGRAEDAQVAGAQQGAYELGGQLSSKVLAKGGRFLSKKADEAMSRIIGYKAGKIEAQKVGAESAREIGKIVNEHVGPSRSTEVLAKKITDVKETFNQQVTKAVSSPQGKLTNLYAIIDDNALKAARQLEKDGNDAAANTLLKRADELRSQYPQYATPQQVLEFKRAINSPSSALREEFTDLATGEANNAIAMALPPKEASQFLQANKKVSNLIAAEEAIRVKDAAEVAKQRAWHVGVGGVAGGYAGYEYEGGRKGAMEGVAAGMIGGAILGSTPAKTTGVGLTKALSSAAEKLAPMAKYSADAKRALDAIRVFSQANQ